MMLVAVSVVMAQKQWTLQECLNYAMDNNITLKKSQLQQQSAAEELKGAKAALLPTFNASTNQSLGYQPWKDSGISTVTTEQSSGKTYNLQGRIVPDNANIRKGIYLKNGKKIIIK